jgi:hypothetical protein
MDSLANTEKATKKKSKKRRTPSVTAQNRRTPSVAANNRRAPSAAAQTNHAPSAAVQNSRAPSTNAADHVLKVGARVSGQWMGEDENHGEWFPGVIRGINWSKKTIHIVFDDDDEDDCLPWDNVVIA